jgi:hypothetical protein
MAIATSSTDVFLTTWSSKRPVAFGEAFGAVAFTIAGVVVG